MSLSYGSAKLMGFLWKDYTCLQPMDLSEKMQNLTNATYLTHITDKEAHDYSIMHEKQMLQ